MDDDDFDIKPGIHETWSADEIESHPLFMTSLASDADNPHIMALQNVLYSDESPAGLCKSFREQGNEALKRGLLDDAIECYQRAMLHGCDDDSVISLVHSNLAQAYLQKNDYTKCVDQCNLAIQRNKANIKAYYRAAVASEKLGLFAQGMTFSTQGLQVNKDNAELSHLLTKLEGLRQSQLDCRFSNKIKPKYLWQND